MAGLTICMIYDESLATSLVDKKIRVLQQSEAYFCFNGTTNIDYLNGRQCFKDYQNVLKSSIFSFGNILEGREKQKIPTDSAPILTYHSIKDQFT